MLKTSFFSRLIWWIFFFHFILNALILNKYKIVCSQFWKLKITTKMRIWRSTLEWLSWRRNWNVFSLMPVLVRIVIFFFIGYDCRLNNISKTNRMVNYYGFILNLRYFEIRNFIVCSTKTEVEIFVNIENSIFLNNLNDVKIWPFSFRFL